MRLFLLIAIMAMTGATTAKVMRHLSPKKEKSFIAVNCDLTPYKEPVIPPPPPCMYPGCPGLVEIIGTINHCCCSEIPPIEMIDPVIEQPIESIPIDPAPIPCVNSAYMNGNWMSHLWSYIRTDSIDHNKAPYNSYSVSFQYRVLPDGTVADLIIDGDAFGAEEMLRKAFEQSTLKWTPAIVDGQPVPSTFQQKIVFYPDNNTPVSIEEPRLLRFDSWL